MRELPSGWTNATLADLGDWSSGGTPNRGNASYFGGDIPFVKTGDLRDELLISVDETITDSGLANSSAKIFPAGTLLIAMYGATIGRTARLAFDASTNQACAALLVNGGNSDSMEFIWKYLKSQTEALKGVGKGGAQPNISQTVLKEFPIPLPPLPEQRRIVRKLDTLTARTTTARTHLSAIEKLVERYRQRMIVAAFSGRLTRTDRTYVAYDKEGLWDVPADWQWRTIEDVAVIQPCLTPVSEIQDLPHIAPDNVEKNTGKLLAYRTIGEDGVISAKHKFFEGQIVYSKIRPYLRKAILSDFDGACSADMYPISVKSNCDLKYLFYWLISEDFSYFTSLSDGRTVLPKINMKQLNAAPVPWCEIEEQREIVRRIETAFAKIDRLAAEAKKALKLTDRLDQRILAKAFAGELVPQDPNDEPARVLLARIRAERAAAPKPKRGRKKASQ